MCVGFVIYLDEDKATEKILSYCKKKFGNDLPVRAEKIIRERITESWKQGKLDANLRKDNWKVTDEKAVSFFRENDRFFLGKQYNKYSEEIRKVIDDELTGKSRSHDKKVVERLRKKMGAALDHPKIKDYYSMVVRNSVNRSRNYSRALAYEQMGISELEIVAILDDSTSDVCREMNGRRIEVKTAADFVRNVISSPVDELDAFVTEYEWPTTEQIKQMPKQSTADILKTIKCKLPPYHARCRTTYVMAEPVRVTNRKGKVLDSLVKPKLDRIDSKRKSQISDVVDERFQEVSVLSKDELASKINSLVSSKWYDRNKLENHYEKWGPSVGAKTGNEYDKLSKKYLSNYDRVFIYRDEGQNRVGFINTSDNMVIGVSPDEHRITTLYPLFKGKTDFFEDSYIELK